VGGVEIAGKQLPAYVYPATGTPIDTAIQGEVQPKAAFDTIFEDATLEQARLASCTAAFARHLHVRHAPRALP
jgi:hypothetical protein